MRNRMLRRGADFGYVISGMLVVLMALSPTVSASAHPASDYYYSSSPLGKWPSTHTEPFLVRNTFPSSSYVSRISESDNAWNTAPGSSLAEVDFRYDGTTTSTGNFDSPCSISWSGVYWRSISGYGATKACKNSSNVTVNFQISINSGKTWYAGTGTPSSSQMDLKSIATHEFGHATGMYGHFLDGPTCRLDSTRNTMCPGFEAQGTTYLRTLETDDKHTFTAAY